MNEFTKKIVQLFCEEAKPFLVDVGKLYSPEWKIRETIQNIESGQLSKSTGSPIRVSKLGGGRLFVFDGNHRVIEAIQAGKKMIDVVLDDYVPDMTKGGGYLDMVKSAVRVVDVVKSITESIEPVKPSSQVKRKWVTKNKGTVQEKKKIEYKFKTKMGNEVKIYITPETYVDDSYDIVFYVNDYLDDAASAINTGNELRDPEILNGVLWVVKMAMNKLGAQRMMFTAYSGKGDNKVIKGMDVEAPKKELESKLKQVEDELATITPKEIPPTENQIALSKKFNKPLRTRYDIDKDELFRMLNKLKSGISNDHLPDIYVAVSDYVYFMENNQASTDFKQQVSGAIDLMNAMKKYREARLSNTEEGLRKERNRRKDLYKKIVDKFFKDEWNVIQMGNQFELVRK